MRHFYKIVIFVSIFLFVGCGFHKVQYTNRTQFISLSPSQEVRLGLQASEQIKKKNRDFLDRDREFLARVKNIGRRIAKAANRDDFNWEFHTISKDILNAFCLPGGKVFVYSGILKAAHNDDQLATVISHEIAHAIARHGAERASMNQVLGIGGQVLSILVSNKAPIYQDTFALAYGFGTNYALMMPYSRTHELEADKIGLILMKKAGYDTREALKFWENMSKISGRPKNANDFFSTHPNNKKRVEQIREFNEKYAR